MTTTTTRYEILAPDPYDHSEFAGRMAGAWEPISDEEFDTIEEAREAIEELQQQGAGTLAIRRVGDHYPEVGEIYTRYEILAPDRYDHSESAGTPAGEWEPIRDAEFDTIEEARAMIEELQQQGFGTLAIRRVGARYPEVGEIYEPLTETE